MKRSQRKAAPPPPPRACEQCGETFQPAREAAFCSSKCRALAFKDRAREGQVASVRRLRNGQMSVIVHMPQDVGITPGIRVRLGEAASQRGLL